MIDPVRSRDGSGSVPAVVRQHAEESASLRNLRSRFMRAAGIRLGDLGRLDERLAAHLDGLVVAGEMARGPCVFALENLAVGEVFTATVRAIEDRDSLLMERLLALAWAVPTAQRGLLSAFGWASSQHLQGTVKGLLNSPDMRNRHVGIAACAMHRVDPGIAPGRLIEASDNGIRARALRAAGELGIRDLLSACAAISAEEDDECQFWAAWSAVLLGDRNRALAVLTQTAINPGPHGAAAYQVVLQALDIGGAHAFLQAQAGEPQNRRWLIRGSGIAGDPAYAGWLVRHMSDDKVARLAGEAFSLITGVDLDVLHLQRKQPENYEAGLNDDPDDPNVEIEEDDGLTWPDPERVQAWWDANRSHFAVGTRYFMGAAVTRESCLRVLKEGFQRQRILAAHYLCLMQPGTPLFEWRAPVWRQRSVLATMD